MCWVVYKHPFKIEARGLSEVLSTLKEYRKQSKNHEIVREYNGLSPPLPLPT